MPWLVGHSRVLIKSSCELLGGSDGWLAEDLNNYEEVAHNNILDQLNIFTPMGKSSRELFKMLCDYWPFYLHATKHFHHITRLLRLCFNIHNYKPGANWRFGFKCLDPIPLDMPRSWLSYAHHWVWFRQGWKRPTRPRIFLRCQIATPVTMSEFLELNRLGSGKTHDPGHLGRWSASTRFLYKKWNLVTGVPKYPNFWHLQCLILIDSRICNAPENRSVENGTR